MGDDSPTFLVSVIPECGCALVNYRRDLTNLPRVGQRVRCPNHGTQAIHAVTSSEGDAPTREDGDQGVAAEADPRQPSDDLRKPSPSVDVETEPMSGKALWVPLDAEVSPWL